MANVKIVRLLTGEDVLGEIVADDKEVVVLKNPVRIMVMPSKTDPKQPTVGFAPFCEWAVDKQVTLNKSLVLTLLTPVVEFVNQYNTTFGSGVVVPDSKLIIP